MFIIYINYIMELRNGTPENNTNLPPLSSIPNQESLEYIPKWKHHQESLSTMFDIDITSEPSLSYPWVKDELYEKVKEGFSEGTYFALDYMFEEGLLTQKDLQERGISSYRSQAHLILNNLRSIGQYNQAKKLFEDTGILSEGETTEAKLH